MDCRRGGFENRQNADNFDLQSEKEKPLNQSSGVFLFSGFKAKPKKRLLAVALLAFALQLTITADGFRLLARFLLRGFLIVAAQLHFAEETFTLHFLLESTQGLVDVVIAYDDLYDGNHLISNSNSCP